MTKAVRTHGLLAGTRLWEAHGEFGEVMSVAFAPDGKSLARCDHQTLQILDADTGRTERVLHTMRLKPRGAPLASVEEAPVANGVR